MSGRELAQQFHADVVAPLLARAMPRLRYAAARLGSGSDVLGLDDAMSRDHDWGCRLTMLVDEADQAAVSLAGQSVLEVVAGPVYADTTAELPVLRRALAWYPPGVERYLIACGWQRLEQRMPLMGRTAG